MRLGVNPRVLWDTAARLQGEGGEAALRRAIRPFNRFLGPGTNLQEHVTGAISGNVLLTLNRLAPLSLGVAENAADYADGVGLLALVQLADRAAALAVLDSIVASQPDVFSRTDSEDEVRYTSSDPSQSFGSMWVRDDLLVISSDFMRRRVRRWVREGSGGSLDAQQAMVSELVSGEAATGLFFRFEPLMPLAIVLNWPSAARQAIGLADTLAFSASVEGDGVRVTGQLSLNEASGEEPGSP